MNRPRIGHPDSEQDVGTPPRVIESITRRLLFTTRFVVDLAASERYHVAETYFTKEVDAFTQDWSLFCGFRRGWAWLNPPFNDIEPWVIRCFQEAQRGAYICMIVPAATDTDWWEKHVDGKAFVVYIGGRFAFLGHNSSYTKPLALLIWTPWVRGGHRHWRWCPPRKKKTREIR